MSDDLHLTDEHLRELTEESGILPDVIAQRGYRTIETKAALRRYGFAPSQGGEGPWLFIPLFAPDSDFKDATGYQIKATRPRVDPTGNVVKYEFPRGTAGIMDVHPSQASRLGDVDVPLYITEGTKKADAAVSLGLLTLSVAGVWGWKAGQLPHEAWNVIPLQGRKVYLAFDSDATTKPGVWDALDALLKFLKKRGSDARPIILPVLSEGSKTGLDDFLREHPVQSLTAYVVDELPERPADEVGKGLFYRSPEGDVLPLANFDARITADVVKDDGLEQSREVEVEANLGDRSTRFILSVDEFEKMSWNIDHLGSDAILFAGRDIPQKAREVIQAKSMGKEERHVYTHTGWRKLRVHSERKAEWVYLSTTGAITSSGLVPHVVVDLGDTMEGVALPDPPVGDETVTAVRDSLLLIDDEFGVMPYQMYFSMWRSVLGSTPFGYWIYGSTGVGKSEIAALAQQHFGAVLTPAKFMANWMSTENYINELAFRAKDMILVVDDFKVSGNRSHELRLMQAADRLFRSQGNTAGRGRMKRDLSLAVGHPVRSMLFSTAEELPEGESLLARMIAEELPRDPTRFDHLDIHQVNAASGQFSKAMASYLKWLAGKYETIQSFLQKQVVENRKTFHGKHRRTQEAGAHLMVGATIFLQFAEDIGAVTDVERGRYLDNLAHAIRKGADEQSEIQRYTNPIRMVRELLLMGILQGKVHIEGWPDSNGMAETIGWVQKEDVVLHSSAFRGAMRRIAKDNDMEWHIGTHRLGQSLSEMGWTKSQDSQGWTQVAKYDGKTYRVYRVPHSFITEVAEDPVDLEVDKVEEAF